MEGPYKQQVTAMELELKLHQHLIEICKNELTDDNKGFKGNERVGKVMCRGVQLRGRPYRTVPEQDLE